MGKLKIKEPIFLISAIVLSLSLFAQELQHEAIAINIEVPVRVFKGDKFIDNLIIKDFYVYEDGVLQKIEAVYLIKKTSIEKEELSIKKEKSEIKFSPKVSRNFVLLFEVQEYLPKLGEAVDYFFDNVILPGDTLTVISPMKTYNFKSGAFEKLSKEEICSQLKGKLKKDARMGSIEYRNLIKDIENLLTARDIPKEVYEQQFHIAADYLRRLETLRHVDQKRLLNFAKFLKKKEGQKNVFLFYQKELIPQIDFKTLTGMTSGSAKAEDMPSIFLLSDLFNFYRRDISFDVNLIKKVFADSSISIHFLYLTKVPMHMIDITRIDALSKHGIKYVEQSEDIFSAFNEVARTTGGLSESSANALKAFKRAVDASENYYLLYYSPKDYKADGKFRKIEVKVKNKKYRITYRAGYIAN